MSSEKRIGVLGGTFDPVHHAHLEIAKKAKDSFQLDTVLFVPSFVSPFKQENKVAPPEDRLEMLRLAIKPFSWAQIENYEIKQKGVSYTIKTLRYLKDKVREGSELFFIMGADSYQQFKGWKDYEDILNLCQLVVAERPGTLLEKLQEIPFQTLSIEKMDLASKEIRKKLKEGGDLTPEIPGPVLAYIRLKDLYS